MQQGMTMDQIQQLRDRPVYSREGEKIGAVEEIFIDYETSRPEWIGIGTGFFGTKRVLVPVQGASLDSEGVRVAYSKDQVKDSPDIDGDDVSQETEYELATHYGLDYSEQRSDTGLPEGRPDSAGDTAQGRASVTRSEEELRVGKQDVERGRARLHKWVETEPVQIDVELTHETARVSREPVNETISGAEIGEEEIEVELRSERPVVQKQAVAKERVTLDKDVETETASVSDEVRKERVEVEDDTR